MTFDSSFVQFVPAMGCRNADLNLADIFAKSAPAPCGASVELAICFYSKTECFLSRLVSASIVAGEVIKFGTEFF